MGEQLTGELGLPIFIMVLVMAMILWALSFARLTPGFRTVFDSRNGISVPWVQVGWLAFAWAFLFASMWPVIDVLLVEDLDFTDYGLTIVGGLLFFFAAARIAPDASYAGADGEARYLEVAPLFFGLFATYQVWLIIMDAVIFDGASATRVTTSSVAVVASLVLILARTMSLQKILSPIAWIAATASVVLQSKGLVDGTLVRADDVAPLQGWIVSLFIGAIALAVVFGVANTMVQVINKHDGFVPYLTHAAWAVWLFGWMALVWWRTPLLVSDGWDYYEFVFFTIGPTAVFLTWSFLMPEATGGDAAAARTQYFDKAVQSFGGLAVLSAWMIVATIWFVDGAEVVTSSIGWAVALVLFVALRRSDNPRLHAGVVTFAWILLASEIAYEIERGVSTIPVPPV